MILIAIICIWFCNSENQARYLDVVSELLQQEAGRQVVDEKFMAAKVLQLLGGFERK